MSKYQLELKFTSVICVEIHKIILIVFRVLRLVVYSKFVNKQIHQIPKHPLTSLDNPYSTEMTLSQGVCCSDHLHCCPHGYTCDVTSLTCTPDLSVLKDSILRFVPIRAQVKATLVHTEEEVSICCHFRLNCIYTQDNVFNYRKQSGKCPSLLVSGIASIFMVDYSSIFPTDDRPIIDFFTPLLANIS